MKRRSVERYNKMIEHVEEFKTFVVQRADTLIAMVKMQREEDMHTRRKDDTSRG